RLSPAVDEPSHIRSGMHLLTGGRYVDPEAAWWTMPDALHPPVDMLPAAVAWMAGRSPDFREDPFTQFHMVRAARWISHLAGAALLVMVLLWGRRVWGRAGGWLATVLVPAQPLILAHASIISTDLTMVTGAVAALWA